MQEWNNMRKNSGKKTVYSEWLAWGVLGAAFLGLLVLNIFWGSNWIDSDMAAEMVFSKLLLDRGEVLATESWYYSTEFRVLYTQLLMEPLLAVFSDWHIVRTITNGICYLLLLAGYFYMTAPLKVKRSTMVWSGVLLLLPFSETFVTHVQMGNTYMCHMIIIFVCFGMFLRLGGRAWGENPGSTGWAQKLRKGMLTGCFVLLNVICGLSGVRYLLALQAPLVLTAAVYLMKSPEYTELRREVSIQQFQKLFNKERLGYAVYSLMGAVSALLGYALNVLVVAEKYTFQTYEATNFISVYQGIFLERLQNTLGSLLMLFGYIPDRGFLSLRGMVTLAGFVLLGGICFVTVRNSKLLKAEGEKKGEYANRRFLLWFFVIAFALNSFVFVFTTSTIVPRYYITVMMFAVPLLAVYFEEEKLPLDRIAVMVILCGCMGLATMKCVFSFIGTDKNADKRQVAAYLSQEGYHFGYGTYWNGNIITELTDGQVEIANINKLEDMDDFLWSSPKKYYQPDYHAGKTFLLLTREEQEKYQEEPAVKEGREVYQDEYYTVLHYDSMEEFQQYREGDRK